MEEVGTSVVVYGAMFKGVISTAGIIGVCVLLFATYDWLSGRHGH